MNRSFPRSSARRRAGLLVAIPLLVLTLAGCTNDEESSEPMPGEEFTIDVPPGDEARFMVEMQQGQRINYSWSAPAVVFFDLHSDQGSGPTTQHSGSAASDEGVYYASRDGLHGWVWRNDGDEAVTVTLRLDGEYSRVDGDGA